MAVRLSVGGGSGVVAERTLFTGPRIPHEIKKMIKPLKSLSQDTFRKILQIIVLGMEGKEINASLLEDIPNNSLNEEAVAILVHGLFKLLQLAMKIPKDSLKEQTFKEDLLELKVPHEFVSDLGSVVFGAKRSLIDAYNKEVETSFPKLECFRWRVDVAISTSVLQRVLEPTVLMEMTLSDGRKHHIEVPIAKFHELRYNVATVLKEMEDLEKRSILKITDAKT